MNPFDVQYTQTIHNERTLAATGSVSTTAHGRNLVQRIQQLWAKQSRRAMSHTASSKVIPATAHRGR